MGVNRPLTYEKDIKYSLIIVVESNTSLNRTMKSKAGKIVTFACFTFIAIAFMKCSIAMADKSGNTSVQKCGEKWEDLDGNCIESCFGGFAVGKRKGENGKLIDVCQCSGEQCKVNPCDECARKAKAKGLPFHCPCADLD